MSGKVQIVPQVVVSRDKNPPSNRSGAIQTRDPARHGEDVADEDRPFSTRISSFGSRNTNEPSPYPGTIAYVLRREMENTGVAGEFILGIANSIRNQGGGGGGYNLMQGAITEAINATINSNPPPNVKDVKEDGVWIRKAIEVAGQFSLSMLEGLPLHGALFEMAGFRLPEIPNIPTALQTNDGMLTQDTFQQIQSLLGQAMSLGQMFMGLMKNGPDGSGAGSNFGGGLGNGISHWEIIHKGLTPEMSVALNNLSTLIQAHETDNGVAFVTGGVVHYGVYLENAVQLLSKVETLDDLMSVLSRLQWDSTLFGIDQLKTLEIQIENAWGKALQIVHPNGYIAITYANSNSQNNFANSMTNSSYSGAATSGSGSGGSSNQLGNIFGKSAQILQQMWKRLASSQEQTATDMHRKLTQQQKAQKHNEINKKTIQGQDPLDDNMFEVTTQ